ncbi:MAG: tRNA (adenosine(37)-N6)-dimethylallyltransferase MiaA [Clostridia bacterium]|nr:tRNA (adenosine(37)-N6)-dimethylallyltransferase MiaA [Clostridia bacterium]
MKPLISVVGTTASGKSGLGIALARHFGGEVISADSRQIYTGFDLGTGKVTEEETEGIPHHLLDIREAGERFSMGEFQALAYDAIDDIHQRGKIPFLVGGTGLYARAVTAGYTLSDTPPDEAFRLEMADKSWEELASMLAACGVTVTDRQISPRRLVRMLEKCRAGNPAENESNPRYRVLQLGLTWEREYLNSLIETRLDRRIEEGMIDEVRRLLENGASEEFMEALGLEYRYTTRYILGKYESFEAYREQFLTEIKRFAKRQQTWFKKDQDIVWLNVGGDYIAEAIALCEAFLSEQA